MSRNEIVNQLKQKYRTRYYGNRVQAIPDLKPEDNAVSFVNNYLNVTVSNLDCEDHEESNDGRHLFSEGRLRTQQDPANNLSTKSRVHDTPQRSQGGGNSVIQSDPKKIRNAIKKNGKQPDLTELFSDEESDDEGRHLVAKLIEESLAENEEIVDGKLANNVEKPREKIYSSDTSVVQEPTSPTYDIHARKWLSFKNATFAANNNVLLKHVARKSEEFTNNAQQLKQLEASNSIKENLHHADITYDLLTASSDYGPKNEFVIEEENSCNIDAWVSPPKKKRLSPPKRHEQTPTPKKTNSNKAFSSLQKKSKNMKASLISSTTAERLSSKSSEAPTPSHAVISNEEEFEINDISDLNESNLFTIPVRAKSMQISVDKKEVDVPAQIHPKKSVNVQSGNTLMPSPAEGYKRSLQKAALSVDAQDIENPPISQGAASREGDEEEAVSSKDAQLPQDLKQDSESDDSSHEDDVLLVEIKGESDSDHTESDSLNSIEQDQQRRIGERKESDQHAEPILGDLHETFSIKNRKEKNYLPVIEIPSGLQRKTKNVNSSPVRSTMAKRLSSMASEAPTPSHAVNGNEEEFEIEDLSDINESNLFTIPVKAKSVQTVMNNKALKINAQIHPKKSVNVQTSNTFIPSHAENVLQKSPERIEPPPITQGAALREGNEEQASKYANVQVVGIERAEHVHKDNNLLMENKDKSNFDHTENACLTMQRTQLIQRKSPRKKSQPAKEDFWKLDETFSIRHRPGKHKAKRAACKKKKVSKQLEEQQKNMLVEEKMGGKYAAEKKIQESNKQRKSSTKDHMSNVLEAKEEQDTSTTKRSPRKRNNTGELLKADEKEHVEETVSNQPDSGRKQNAKLRNNHPPYSADHDKEESVFQSGPVTRQTRAVRLVGPVKPIAYDLDVPDKEAESSTGGPKTDSHISGKKQVIVERFVGGPKTDPQILEAQRELLKRCSIVFDPDTKSDALIECVAQSEMSTFLGDESCKYWSNFNNSIFSTGKMIIAPKRKSERCIFLSDIVVYYVEKGKVQLNLHKTERILKDGDFFFVPPGNSCSISNLQDTEAVLVFNCIKIHPLSTD
ncbi:centromere protein C-like isoform X2 [Hyla sarda]|uniref:centromere protein C-like isoform X2 n=1 Tax=Hyla sarda TaxID=327740 RepID=UPI0024C30C38|nr:centromere protein C-like isoform X2 [Hyla sarda]